MYRYALAFLTPGLPFVPTIAITVNMYLIFKLSILTLVRFTIWMTIGMIMYFYYGISHSTLEQLETDVLELAIDDSRGRVPGGTGEEEKAVWDQSISNSTNQYHEQTTTTPEPIWSKPITDRKPSLCKWTHSECLFHSIQFYILYIAKHSSPHTSSTTTTNANRTISSQRKVPPTSNTATVSTSTGNSGGTVRGNLGSHTGSIFVDETEFPTWED